MTDKKNINNSLKNQDKNFNKNSTHENNRIIIDGVDIIDCDYFYVEQETDQVKCDNYSGYCREHKNCPFKQLARKTQLSIEQSKELIRLRKKLQESTIKNRNLKQECEELENKIKKLRKNLALEIGINGRYRKALEEIEEVCIKDTREFADGTAVRYDSLDEILDIINKAKEITND